MAYEGPTRRLEEGKRKVEWVQSREVQTEMLRLTSELGVGTTLESERPREVTPATPKGIES